VFEKGFQAVRGILKNTENKLFPSFKLEAVFVMFVTNTFSSFALSDMRFWTRDIYKEIDRILL
jgi:hypothetical protein